MSSKAQQLVDKAARLLDLRGDVAAAETALREAVQLAESEGRWITLAQATTFLAEMLTETGRANEGLPLFERVIDLAKRADFETDAIDHEVQIAQKHLAKAAGVEPPTAG